MLSIQNKGYQIKSNQISLSLSLSLSFILMRLSLHQGQTRGWAKGYTEAFETRKKPNIRYCVRNNFLSRFVILVFILIVSNYFQESWSSVFEFLSFILVIGFGFSSLIFGLWFFMSSLPLLVFSYQLLVIGFWSSIIIFWSLVFGRRSSVFCLRSSVLVISRRSSVIGRRSSVVGLRYYHCTIYKIFGLRKSSVTWSSVHPWHSWQRGNSAALFDFTFRLNMCLIDFLRLIQHLVANSYRTQRLAASNVMGGIGDDEITLFWNVEAVVKSIASIWLKARKR